MNRRINLVVCSIVLVFFLMLITGCGGNTYKINQINPIEKDINKVTISKGNSRKDVTDRKVIERIINDLNQVTLNKLAPSDDNRVMENGNALKKVTTVTVELWNFKGDNPQGIFILFSERELYVVDVKSMDSGRTTSYLSGDNYVTLKAVKDLNWLINENGPNLK